MSSLRKDSKQHRSITAPFWKNQTQARQQDIAHFIYEKQQLQSESDFCDVTLVCDDVNIETHKFIFSSYSPFLKYYKSSEAVGSAPQLRRRRRNCSAR